MAKLSFKATPKLAEGQYPFEWDWRTGEASLRLRLGRINHASALALAELVRLHIAADQDFTDSRIVFDLVYDDGRPAPDPLAGLGGQS